MLKLKDKLLDLFFPARCVMCLALGSFLCSSCAEKIIKIKAQSCPYCGRITDKGRACSSCRSGHELTGLIAGSYFKDPIVKELVHQYKYEGLSAAKTELTNILAEAIKETEISFDIVVCAPMSRRRYNERGYNQAELLAQELSKIFDKPVSRGLKKKKHTKTQVGLRRKERLANLEGAIFVQNGQSLVGKKVLLVDDVFTTGTTLDVCAKALRTAGAKEVWGAVVAKE